MIMNFILIFKILLCFLCISLNLNHYLRILDIRLLEEFDVKID